MPRVVHFLTNKFKQTGFKGQEKSIGGNKHNRIMTFCNRPCPGSRRIVIKGLEAFHVIQNSLEINCNKYMNLNFRFSTWCSVVQKALQVCGLGTMKAIWYFICKGKCRFCIYSVNKSSCVVITFEYLIAYFATFILIEFPCS